MIFYMFKFSNLEQNFAYLDAFRHGLLGSCDVFYNNMDLI